MKPPDMSMPVEGHPELRYVAWHGGGAVTLRTGRRHVATLDAVERRAPRETLCGRAWKLSRAVVPNDYWTTGDCKSCFRKAGLS